ncbi:bifunctional RNase H/acid phosphatase [Streptomyces sp. SP2-10]|uniref:bifunctional RNase H/acid phosphatase n=1 Tax=Streptomyces sp. SP2-10 TaxID=2873385 RepID=UPI001CA6CAA3|nr:bifunctional RNase H/acid phosphatase [Streptomyces sp. SP2-10]MBY8846120.1 bifunctional RNase H/acid phosphatase [Streptomyces sp. SP2-10]
MREFIVEADGGSRGNPGPAGYGAVVSDAVTGETLAEAAEYIGIATNNVAEYRGLLAGLRAAHALDPAASVHVRMDSKLVVEQMSGRWKIKHPDMKPLATEARSVFPPDRVGYEWIPRDRNKHADRLANEAMDAGAKGQQWSPSHSRAALDTPPAVPEPSGPPGDAAAGAARARAALAEAAAPAEGAGEAPAAGSRAAGAARVGAAAPPGGQRPSPPGDRHPTAPGDRHPTAPGDRHPTAPGGPRPEGARQPSTPGWSAAPDLGAPATLVLLRHGETPLTPQKRFSGSGGTDPSLSDAGREQARRVAEALARRGTVQAIVASPLARTRETAGIVADRLGLDVAIEDGLRETDFGAWEGLTFGEVRERHPEDLNAWLADPGAHPTGGGESFAETAVRIEAAREKLVAAYAGRTVLLVTHVTPIKTFVRLALGAPDQALFRMELSAASLSAVAYYADGNASVRLFNDTSHLRP